MSKRRVTKREVFVDENKLGKERSTNSVEAKVAGLIADRVEETSTQKAYVTKIENDETAKAPPIVMSAPSGTESVASLESAPSVDGPSKPPAYETTPKQSLPSNDQTFVDMSASTSPPPSGRNCNWLYVLAAAAVAVLFVLFNPFGYNAPVQLRLFDATWSCTAQLQKYDTVIKNGDVPPPGAKILSADTVRGEDREVVVGSDEICEDKTEEYEEFDHYESVCRDVSTGRFQENEVYSHTEKVCYDDGTCEQKEIFDKKKVPVMEKKCEDKPVTAKKTRPVRKCRQQARVTKEATYKPKYFWSVQEWVNERQVEDKGVGSAPAMCGLSSLSKEDSTRRLRDEKFSFALRFENGDRTSVSREEYERMSKRVGERINLLKGFFGYRLNEL
eukprot:TRINITY_DN2063_c0_g1_i1.p1 TRINITY_DN2063_c0_g1~~TRINITY_DN2063_c0_g1_i1.p1  ORF type:complete len:388 (-),score=74.78 TRINITY_DN2063_c0_g1_i1:209-1372(-)